MQVLWSLDPTEASPRGAELAPSEVGCVTIGNFDGVHLGHQALLASVVERARRYGLPAAVVTFDPHPVRFFRGPALEPFLITTTRQKLACFAALGIELALVVPFDATLAAMDAQAFVQALLVDRLQPREVLVGYDFRFGRGRSGGLDEIAAAGKDRYRVDAFGPLEDDARPVSSSRVREAVRAGEVEEAARLLGRPFALEGLVVGGDKRGRELGFPTANLAPEPELLEPAFGIYVSSLVEGERVLPAVTSIGVRPTYYEDEASAPRTVETYVLEAPAELDLYDRRVEVQLHRRLRPELKFESTEALVAQIERDVADARAWHGLAG